MPGVESGVDVASPGSPKVIQTPREIAMPAEANSGMRPLPNKDTVQPWWYGAGYGAHSPAQLRPRGLPAALTISANQYPMPGDELMEFICNGNNTSVKHFAGNK